MPDAPYLAGRKGLAPNTPTAFTGILAKIIQRVWKQRWQNLPYKSSCSSRISHQQKSGEGRENGEKIAVQAREARAAVEENKKAQLELINSLANSKNKRRWRKNIKPGEAAY